MNETFVKISSKSDMLKLFKIPFQSTKCCFTQDSDFFNDGNGACKINCKQVVVEGDDESFLHKKIPEFTCKFQHCGKLLQTIHEFEIHNKSSHTNYCIECKKSFPSDMLLQAHIEEYHDSYLKAAAEKYGNSYCCLVKGCNESFRSIENRKQHIHQVHTNSSRKNKSIQLQSVKRSEIGNLNSEEISVAVMDTSDSLETSCAINTSEINEIHSTDMDTVKSEEFTSVKKWTYKPRIPKHITFGQGMPRTFTPDDMDSLSKTKNKPEEKPFSVQHPKSVDESITMQEF